VHCHWSRDDAGSGMRPTRDASPRLRPVVQSSCTLSSSLPRHGSPRSMWARQSAIRDGTGQRWPHGADPDAGDDALLGLLSVHRHARIQVPAHGSSIKGAEPLADAGTLPLPRRVTRVLNSARVEPATLCATAALHTSRERASKKGRHASAVTDLATRRRLRSPVVGGWTVCAVRRRLRGRGARLALCAHSSKLMLLPNRPYSFVLRSASVALTLLSSSSILLTSSAILSFCDSSSSSAASFVTS